MTILKEQYIVNKKGEKTGVVLDIEAFRKILKDLEELESIRAYDRAKAESDERILFDEAIEEIKASRK